MRGGEAMASDTATVRTEAHTKGDFVPDLLFPVDEMGQRVRFVDAKDQKTNAGLEAPRELDLPELGAVRAAIPILLPTTIIEPRGRFQSLQQYEGVVLSVGEESFWAKLTDKAAPGREDEEGEFAIEEVSETDRHLITPGAVFYWHLGYHDSVSRQRTRQSIILFRRLPAISGDCLERSRKKAQEFLEAFALAEKGDAGGEK